MLYKIVDSKQMQSNAPAHNDTPPPPIVRSASTRQEVTMYDIISFTMFVVFSAVAIYFGIKYGSMYSKPYWIVIQKFGEYLGTWIRQQLTSIRQQRVAYTAAQSAR
jgi:hypothetical protein